MGMQVNTNLAALNAHRNLSNTQNDLSKSLEKLSSGLRINRAADDAAGLAISEGLRSQVNGMTVAARNAQDGISVIQTAEGSLNEVQSILQRMRDLAVQAGNDSNNAESRAAITKEASALTSELQRISESTNFGGINLLDGSAGGNTGKLQFQVGAEGAASSQIALDLSGSNVGNTTKALNGLDADGNNLVRTSQTGVAVAAATVTGDVTIAQAGGKSVTIAFGAADAARTDDEVLATLQAGIGDDFIVKAGATAGQYDVIAKDHTNAGAVTMTGGAPVTGGAAGTANVGPLNFGSATGAQDAIETLDSQITAISAARADLGAVQNRFESTINSLNVSRENLQAAESRIRDVDMAAEMVSFTRSNILSQAGTAMLAQANQSNQGVLQLLG